MNLRNKKAITTGIGQAIATAFALFLAIMVFLLLPAKRAAALETDCVIHDPSTMIQSDGAYWIFGTGPGIAVYSSPDRQHWTRQPPVFAVEPAWIAAALPRHLINNYWAPDIRRIGGRYCLYYAVSVFGHNISAIGLATSPSLQKPQWTDRGIVVRSRAGDDYNAIDPCVTEDATGALWLCYGSYWSGIQVTQLDRSTGLALPDVPTYFLASHPQDSVDSIEAPSITFHGGYYYLFVDWGFCCRGERSTYALRVGRSRAITGPYRDRERRDMRTGGGSLFLGTIGGSGRKEIGPGHAGIESSASGDWFSCHYEWAQDHHGQSMLNVFKLVWDSDGWPALASP